MATKHNVSRVSASTKRCRRVKQRDSREATRGLLPAMRDTRIDHVRNLGYRAAYPSLWRALQSWG